MAILPICIWGDPVLHQPAEPVTAVTPGVRKLVADMFETVDAAPGVGLAAPQVGVPARIYVYTYKDDVGAPWRGVVVNPELWMTPPEPGHPDPDTEVEGCLSFPGERFPLRRSSHVRVTGTDLDGEPILLDVMGWRARIMQHEYDHLNGFLYVDRLEEPHHAEAMRTAADRGWGGPRLSWMPVA